MLISLLFFVGILGYSIAGTSIGVTNSYSKELNIKIQGAGVGGCDVLLDSGEIDLESCWCLWGTLNYSFCAYEKSKVKGINSEGDSSNFNNSTAHADVVANGRCPTITGEKLVCSDLASLGNCYDKSYTCLVDEEGLCHCSS